MSERQRTRICVISMPDAKDRRATFEDRAKTAPVAWEFFDACTTVVPGLTYDEARAKVLMGRSLTAGEIGCYASHFALWRKLADGDDEQYIILEDDVIADWKYLERLTEVDFSRSGIDYLRLYCRRPAWFVVRRFYYLGKHLIELTDRAFGTQGYVITRSGAERLIAHCSRIVRPIDSQLDRSWEHGLPNLSIFPFPILEEFGQSMIGTGRGHPADGLPSAAMERKLSGLWGRLRRRAWLLSRTRAVIGEPREFGS